MAGVSCLFPTVSHSPASSIAVSLEQDCCNRSCVIVIGADVMQCNVWYVCTCNYICICIYIYIIYIAISICVDRCLVCNTCMPFPFSDALAARGGRELQWQTPTA